MGVTIKDIAKLAHVSATTVSNVINGKTSKTTEETKERILKLVNDLDYKPNAMARSLVNGRTKLVGLIVPDISDSRFSKLARAVEDAGRRFGYSILVCSTYNSAKNEQAIINRMREHCVDGIIISPSTIKEKWQFKDILKLKYPLVTLGRNIDDCEDVCNVCSNNYKSGYDAAKCLIELGHRNIGCIAGESWLRSTMDLVEGFKKAVNDYNIDITDNNIYCDKQNMKTGLDGTDALLGIDKRVTGIVACSDMIAYGVYKSAAKHRMLIPRDLSVVGIGDLDFSSIVTPELTVMKKPIDEIADTAMEMLISIITKKPREKNEYRYDSKLVMRESTAKNIL